MEEKLLMIISTQLSNLEYASAQILAAVSVENNDPNRLEAASKIFKQAAKNLEMLDAICDKKKEENADA